MFGSRALIAIVVVMVLVAAFAALYYNQGFINWVAEEVGYQSRMIKIKINREDATLNGYRTGGALAGLMNSSMEFISPRTNIHLDAEDGVWIPLFISLQGYEEMKKDYGDHPCYKF